jgi:mannose/cellobiose epimerase-like protein (N-acyl-D-glucosamine 2-epimerase family)
MRRVLPGLLLLAVAFAAEAQTDKAARCAELGALYDRYAGRRGEGSGGPSLDRAGAALDCQKGNYDQGIKTLENLLRRSAIAVPPG